MTNTERVPEPCPTCGSRNTVYDAVYGFWKCKDCSGAWADDADDPDYAELEDADQGGGGVPPALLTFIMSPATHPQEWHQAWAQLADLNDGDPVCQCPRTGQTWQYICTAKTEDGWMHYFRHSNHPSTRCRECLLIPYAPECLSERK